MIKKSIGTYDNLHRSEDFSWSEWMSCWDWRRNSRPERVSRCAHTRCSRSFRRLAMGESPMSSPVCIRVPSLLSSSSLLRHRSGMFADEIVRGLEKPKDQKIRSFRHHPLERRRRLDSGRDSHSYFHQVLSKRDRPSSSHPTDSVQFGWSMPFLSRPTIHEHSPEESTLRSTQSSDQETTSSFDRPSVQPRDHSVDFWHPTRLPLETKNANRWSQPTRYAERKRERDLSIKFHLISLTTSVVISLDRDRFRKDSADR